MSATETIGVVCLCIAMTAIAVVVLSQFPWRGLWVLAKLKGKQDVK